MTAPVAHSTALSTATVTSAGQGAQTIAWNVPLNIADEVMALMTREVQQRLALGQDVDPRLVASLAPLSTAITEGYDRMITETVGCLDIEPGDGLLLTDAAITEITDSTATVLLPGAHDAVDAIGEALAALEARGIAVDATNPDLIADVSRPRWMLLRPCGNTQHAAHTEIAPEGAATRDAVLITVVEFVQP